MMLNGFASVCFRAVLLHDAGNSKNTSSTDRLVWRMETSCVVFRSIFSDKPGSLQETTHSRRYFRVMVLIGKTYQQHRNDVLDLSLRPCQTAQHASHFNKRRKSMPEKPTLTTSAGAPIADNQNAMTAGPRGPVLLQDYQLI